MTTLAHTMPLASITVATGRNRGVSKMVPFEVGMFVYLILASEMLQSIIVELWQIASITVEVWWSMTDALWSFDGWIDEMWGRIVEWLAEDVRLW